MSANYPLRAFQQFISFFNCSSCRYKTAIIIDAAVKYARVSTSRPTAYMWCMCVANIPYIEDYIYTDLTTGIGLYLHHSNYGRAEPVGPVSLFTALICLAITRITAKPSLVRCCLLNTIKYTSHHFPNEADFLVLRGKTTK